MHPNEYTLFQLPHTKIRLALAEDRRSRTMTEMEKMEAMKRAYADMILNTAKEAAARVMAAELRARRMEQELISVKEEAASMLLRLKQMIDIMTKEADIKSLDQKNKFEELESQLNEAEEIILDLREELNQGHEQLDKLKKKQVALRLKNEENAEECNLTAPVIAEETFSDAEKLNQRGNCTNAENVSDVQRTSVVKEDIQRGNNEAASIVRRSVRKRKLKFWDDVIAVCGLQSSHQSKKPRNGSKEIPCLPTRKMKRCAKSGEDRAKTEPLADAEVSNEAKCAEAEAVPENMELVDVVVKQDELAATLKLNSASRIECVVDNVPAVKASNLSHGDDDKLCKYTFNRRLRRKSVIYPENVFDRRS